MQLEFPTNSSCTGQECCTNIGPEILASPILPYSALPQPSVSLQTNSHTKLKRLNAFTYLGIVLKSPDNSISRPLSAPRIGVHHTSMSFSGPSKNPTLSISRIHATDDLSYQA